MLKAGKSAAGLFVNCPSSGDHPNIKPINPEWTGLILSKTLSLAAFPPKISLKTGRRLRL
jgi:hypothetical protein